MHSSLELGMFFRRSYSSLGDKTISLFGVNDNRVRAVNACHAY